jgi:hypothetical protein
MLIVEDGTGLPNADSYISLADADLYHSNLGNAIWETISEGRREQLLRQATNYITYIFGPSFSGVRATAGQNLAWPRISTSDYLLYSQGVPRAVKEATAELALIAHSTPLLPVQTTVRKKRVKIGPIEVEYDANSLTGPRFVAATSKLTELLANAPIGGIQQARLVRT